METHLRNDKKRKAANSKKPDEGDAECPVCLNTLSVRRSGRTNATLPNVTWPCGHVVCGACDRRMMETNHHRCAVCRTLRQGFTEEDADLAARVRVLSDAAHAVAGSDGVGTGVGTVMRHAGRNYEVIFFANQSQGDPFRALRDAANSMRGEDLDTPDADNAVDFAEADDDGVTGRIVRARHASSPTAIPNAMGDLIRELLRPTSIDVFLARRQALNARGNPRDSQTPS